MLLRKYIVTAFKIPISVKKLLEPTGLITFLYSIHRVERYRNLLVDMKGILLFRSIIIILTVITFILFVSLEHRQRYYLLSNQNDVQPTFTQVQCLIPMPDEQEEKALVVSKKPSRTHLRGCQGYKLFSGFAFLSTVKSAESLIKNISLTLTRFVIESRSLSLCTAMTIPPKGQISSFIASPH